MSIKAKNKKQEDLIKWIASWSDERERDLHVQPDIYSIVWAGATLDLHTIQLLSKTAYGVFDVKHGHACSCICNNAESLDLRMPEVGRCGTIHVSRSFVHQCTHNDDVLSLPFLYWRHCDLRKRVEFCFESTVAHERTD